MAPIAVAGDPTNVISRANAPSDMSQYVPLFLDKFIDYTRDLMGASDAALGNVNPQNTSAIIAVQKATAYPLELVKQEYYQFIEDYVRIVIDIMGNYYGQRTVNITDENGDEHPYSFNFETLKEKAYTLNIDIGATSYWQETTDVSTLDNLYANQLIDDITYLESLPAHYIPNRAKIIQKAKERKEQAQLIEEQQQSPETAALLDDSLMPMNQQGE